MEEKKRKVMFSVEDQLVLLDLILVEKDIIENKTTNKFTNDEKDKAWQKITAKFNSSTLHPRTVDQLKSKFDNLKTKARKVVAAQKSSSRGTGGGAPIKDHFDPLVESTLKIINKKTVVGLSSPFDCDGVENVEINIIPFVSHPDDNSFPLVIEETGSKQNQSVPVEVTQDLQLDQSPVESEEVVQQGAHKEETENWSSYNPRKLKKPVSRNLRTQVRNPLSIAKEEYYKKKKEVLENEEKRKKEEHEIKLQLLKLQVLEMQIKMNIEPRIVVDNK